MTIMESSPKNYGEVSLFITKTSKNTSNNNYGSPNFRRQTTIDNLPETDQQHENDFFKSIKGFLIFGKLIGVLPFSGIFGNSWRDLSLRKKSFSAIISYGIVSVLVFNVILGIVQLYRAPKRNALEFSNSIRLSVFCIWGCLIYIYFLYKGQTFLDIFQVWTSIDVTYSKRDTTLRRDIFLIASGILTSAILENLVIHGEYFKSLDKYNGNMHKDKHTNMTHLETYYWRAHPHWATVIGYNWFFAVLAFFHHKWLLYSWNYMDITIALFGRAMSFRFKCLFEEAENKLLGSKELQLSNLGQVVCNDRSAWMQVVHDHKSLCRLLNELENFLSPMIFFSYLVNIYYICMQLLDFLTSEITSYSIVHSIYSPWSFLHLVARTFTVSICCAHINVYAHKTRKILEECPQDYYNTEVSRNDIRITAGPDIGLTGLGCFTVTKPFILKILSVVFTFEIVLLQCVP